jgi:hypothetical protein
VLGSPHPAQPVAVVEPAALLASYEDLPTVGASVASDALMKSDRLQVVYVQPDLDVKPTTVENSSASVAAGVAPKIISRHWHDPSDQRAAQVARKSKAGDPKKNIRIVDRKPASEADSCKKNGLEGLRQLFNSPRNCASTN